MNSRLLARTAIAILCTIVALNDAPAQPTTSEAEGRFAAIDGMRMYYQVHGTGKPLLLLHWYDATGSHAWEPFIEKLSAEYQLIIPDMRGHGRTFNPDKEFSIRQCARDIIKLLDHLKIKKCDAMGTSLGGMTMLHVATKEPERVSSMVLVGAGIYFTEPARRFMREEVAQLYRDRPKYLKLMKSLHPGGDEQIRQLCMQFAALADDYNDVNFTQPYLGTIKARTLIMSGDDDPYFTPKMQLEMHASIPVSSLWIVPGGGHLPHLNMTDEFLSRSMRFMRGKN